MENLLCTSCAGKIEKAINKLEYVDQADYNLATQTMTLETNNGVEDQVMLKQVTKIVDSIETGVTVYFKNKRIVEEKTDYGFYMAVIGVIIFLFASFFNSVPFIWVGYLFAANKIIRKAISSVIHKSLFDENTLMFIATLAAMYIKEYYEGIAVLVFYSVGEYFQERAVKKSKKEIENLVNLKVDTVTVIRGLKEYQVNPEELSIGDVMLIPNGKLIPVDGIVTKGQSSLDTAQITGESLPHDVIVNDNVISGSINIGAVLQVEVTNTYENSTLYKIISLIENSTSNKSDTEKFITKFAKYYTPIVAVIAALLVLVPTIINQANFNEYLYRGAIFLVISCPCALVLSIPLSYFAGIGKSASLGVLYKGSNHLEALTKTKNLFTDKTGTLTKGNFEVDSFTNDYVLQLAASLEKFSTHPIAKAIQAAYTGELVQFEDIEEKPGFGLSAKLDGKNLVLGNEKLLNEYGIEVPQTIGTSVYVALDNEYLGNVIIKDQLKESSIEAVKGFLSHGIEVYMLTGDKDDVAKEVATELGIHYKSGLLPDEKLAYMDSIDGENIFIGDGINDAPSLVNSDVGISMGAGGSDLAIEVADVIVMDDSLMSMFKSFEVSLKTKQIVIQNIVFALGIKLVFLGLGGFGLSSMWMAIFADVGVSLIAVLNSLRILKREQV
jgi:Cd2+/Zn2+-exporting ATPase